MEPVFLTCIAIAWFLTKGKVDSTAYANGKEPPGVAKARMRHAAGGGARTPAGKPKGPGAFRLMLASRWANACQAAKQRGDHKAARRRAWYDETAPLKDEKWREKKLARLQRAEAAQRNWAGRQGLLDLTEYRDRKAEGKAWDENARRDADGTEAAETSATDAKSTEGADETKPGGGDAPAPPATMPPPGWVPPGTADATKPVTATTGAEPGRDPVADLELAGGPDTPGEPPKNGHQAAPAAAATSAAATNGTNKKSTEGSTTVYQQAVARLIRAADQVAEYRADLAAFADTLAGKKWGAEVTGPVQDMDTRLTTIEGTYRDLAAQMKHQGDQGSGAYDQAPWVPGPQAVLA